MAKKTRIIWTDDLDGTELGEDGQTVQLSIGKESREIDLTPEHAAELARLLEPYLAAGRKTSAPVKRGRPAGTEPAKVDPEQKKKIREWALSQPGAQSKRGRLSQATIDDYNAAHRPGSRNGAGPVPAGV